MFTRPAQSPLSASTLSGNPFPKTAAPSAPPPRPSATAVPRERAPLAASETEPKKLVVGQGIMLSGQISSCERLVVEGTVECSINECRNIDIAEPGFFKGQADVDYADVAGRFEGTLTARERLFVRSTGRIHGKIHYSQIEIEPGGEISGDVKVIPPTARAHDDAGDAGDRAYANGEAN